MARAVLIWLALSGLAMAEEFRPVSTADEVVHLLTGVTLSYDNAVQTFHETGRTNYTTDTDSWGRWQARGAQYCSAWPPGDTWACYDLHVSADNQIIRFIGSSGGITDGRVVE